MYSQGDILLVPLPFTDLSSQKRRPVLVLSKDEYNDTMDDLVVVAITSNIDSKKYIVLLTNNDMADGTLRLDSCIRADKIYTLSQNIVVKRFGKVNSEIIDTAKVKISEMLGINQSRKESK
jgi:mRNA interferase MazF